MLLTILILVVAVAMFLGAGMVVSANKKQSAAMHYAKKTIMLASIVLMVWGVNRTGLGTQSYLVNSNPMILQEMVESMREIQTSSATKEIKSYVSKNAAALEENAPVIGNVNGSKVIYLFSAYTCPYCVRVHGELVRAIEADSDVKVVLKNFSVHGIASDIPAKATIAAKIQGNDKAGALDALLMKSQEWMGDRSEKKVMAGVMKLAKEAGLDVKKLEKDMDESREVAQEMMQVRDLSQRFQISGTPFLIINNQSFPGAIPFEQIMAALNN